MISPRSVENIDEIHGARQRPPSRDEIRFSGARHYINRAICATSTPIRKPRPIARPTVASGVWVNGSSSDSPIEEAAS